MRSSRVIRLVLLGGGAATMLAACGDDRARREACERARAELRPDAAQICQRSSSSGSGGSGGRWYSWSDGRTSGGADVATSSRGGFGSTGHSFSGGG